MIKETFVVEISAETNKAERVRMYDVTTENVCKHLQTDEIQRIPVSKMPPFLMGCDGMLCYVIDAKGYEKALPSNLCGTCLFHTGQPILGTILFVICPEDISDPAMEGFDASETEQLLSWLIGEFPFLTK